MSGFRMPYGRIHFRPVCLGIVECVSQRIQQHRRFYLSLEERSIFTNPVPNAFAFFPKAAALLTIQADDSKTVFPSLRKRRSSSERINSEVYRIRVFRARINER